MPISWYPIHDPIGWDTNDNKYTTSTSLTGGWSSWAVSSRGSSSACMTLRRRLFFRLGPIICTWETAGSPPTSCEVRTSGSPLPSTALQHPLRGTSTGSSTPALVLHVLGRLRRLTRVRRLRCLVGQSLFPAVDALALLPLATLVQPVDPGARLDGLPSQVLPLH